MALDKDHLVEKAANPSPPEAPPKSAPAPPASSPPASTPPSTIPPTAPPASVPPISAPEPSKPPASTPAPPASAPQAPAPSAPAQPQPQPQPQPPAETAPPSSVTTTVLEAAETIILSTAANIGTHIQTKNADDLHAIGTKLAGEVVEAAGIIDDKDDKKESILEQVGDAIQDVVEDVIEGVEHAGQAVAKHPELILEGAVIAATAAVGLVAPALAVGAVAVVGKMAADHAMATLDGIAKETASGVVREVARDLVQGEKGEEVTVQTTTVSTQGGDVTVAFATSTGPPAATSTAATVVVEEHDPTMPQFRPNSMVEVGALAAEAEKPLSTDRTLQASGTLSIGATPAASSMAIAAVASAPDGTSIVSSRTVELPAVPSATITPIIPTTDGSSDRRSTPPSTTARPLPDSSAATSGTAPAPSTTQPTIPIPSAIDSHALDTHAQLTQLHHKIDAIAEHLETKKRVDELHQKLEIMQLALDTMTAALLQSVQSLHRLAEQQSQGHGPTPTTQQIAQAAVAALYAAQEHGSRPRAEGTMQREGLRLEAVMRESLALGREHEPATAATADAIVAETETAMQPVGTETLPTTIPFSGLPLSHRRSLITPSTTAPAVETHASSSEAAEDLKRRGKGEDGKVENGDAKSGWGRMLFGWR